MTVTVRAQALSNPTNLNENVFPLFPLNVINTLSVNRTATPNDSIANPLNVRFNLTGVSNPATGPDFTVLVFDGITQLASLTGDAFVNNGITIPANLSTVQVRFTVFDDNLFEGSTPEVLSIDLVPTANYVLDPGFLNTLNVGQIVDNELPPTISITSGGGNVAENAGNATFVVTQSVASGLPTTFTFTITPFGAGIAAATPGQDYTNITGTFTIPAGQTSVIINVPILDDTIFEPSQSFNVAISAPVNATLSGIIGVGTTIIDNEVAPIIGINSPAAVLEGSPVNFVVGFTGATTATEFGAVTGTINTNGVTAVAGADYNPLLAQAFSIPALATSITVPVTTLVDTIAEPTETFQALLSGIAAAGGGSVTNGTLVGTGTIADNNPVSVALSAGTPNPITEGTGVNPNVSFTATLGANITTATTYNVVLAGTGANPAIIGTAVNTPAGTDAFPTVAQVTFPANSVAGATQNFTATIVGDAVSEPNELFTVQLQPVANGLILINSNAPTVTILDDDSIVNITATLPNASEAGAPGRFTITRNAGVGDLTVNYTIGGTASNGGANADFIQTLVGTAVIPSGSNSVDINILPIADTLTEGTETVILTLAAGAGYAIGANTVANVNIADLNTGAAGFGTLLRIGLSNLFLGNNNADTGVGTILNDTIAGFAGDDLIFGLAGNDSLSGGFGNDTLVGGAGNDTLLGSIGADTFRFILPTDGIDTIQDFTLSDNDRIEISAIGFGGGLVVGALPGGAFGYNSVTGALSINGTQIATLINTPAITTANIFVI